MFGVLVNIELQKLAADDRGPGPERVDTRNASPSGYPKQNTADYGKQDTGTEHPALSSLDAPATKIQAPQVSKVRGAIKGSKGVFENNRGAIKTPNGNEVTYN